jgi:tetratricopeptide (TPR) repeat protein
MPRKTIHDWMKEGGNSFDQGNYQQALFAFEQAAKLDPSDRAISGMRGMALNHLGRYQEAYHVLSPLLRQAPKVPPRVLAVWYAHAGWALNQLDRSQEAYHALTSSLRLEPQTEAWVYGEMACALNCLGRFQEGYDAVCRALALQPNAPASIHVDAAWSLLELGRFQEALAASERAIKADPAHDMAYNNRGVALNNLHRYREALSCFERAIHLNSQNALYYRNAGIALRGLNNIRGAVVMYDRALTLNPQDEEASRLRQEIYSNHKLKLFLDHLYGPENRAFWDDLTTQIALDDWDEKHHHW